MVRRDGVSNEKRKTHLVGSGIPNLAAAAYLIKDGSFSGANISITRRRVYRVDALTQLGRLKRVTSYLAKEPNPLPRVSNDIYVSGARPKH